MKSNFIRFRHDNFISDPKIDNLVGVWFSPPYKIRLRPWRVKAFFHSISFASTPPHVAWVNMFCMYIRGAIGGGPLSKEGSATTQREHLKRLQNRTHIIFLGANCGSIILRIVLFIKKIDIWLEIKDFHPNITKNYSEIGGVASLRSLNSQNRLTL